MNQRKHLLSVSFLLILFFSAKSDPPKTAKHFVLVHGSCHGGWSWYKLVPLLKSTGHAVTALDLAASGVDLRQPKDLRSISDYFGPLTELMEALPANERVVLVGHSLGGLAISQAMERFPAKISVAVFVTAQMPGPSLNISTLNREVNSLALRCDFFLGLNLCGFMILGLVLCFRLFIACEGLFWTEGKITGNDEKARLHTHTHVNSEVTNFFFFFFFCLLIHQK